MLFIIGFCRANTAVDVLSKVILTNTLLHEENMSKYIEKIEKYVLPAIPLRGLVVFPGMPVSFEIKREKSILAMQAVPDGGEVFLVTQMDSSVDDPGTGDLYRMGVIAEIKQSMKLPDDSYRVLVEATCRAEIRSCLFSEPYMRCEVFTKDTFMSDGGGVKGEALMRSLLSRLEKHFELMPKVADELIVAAQSITDPGVLADFSAFNFLFRFPDKQEILSEIDPLRRLEKTAMFLENEDEVLQAEYDIHSKVRTRIDGLQKERYLREQLSVIKAELGEGEEYDEEIVEYREKIEKIKNAEVSEKLGKECSKLAKTPYSSTDSTVLRNYLDACIEFPWDVTTKEKYNVETARKILDEDHDGLEKIKERILEYIAVKQISPSLKGQILCFVGPPGVGKTSVASSIARAVGRKFVRVSLGGVRDEADIRGHRKTYVAAMPGRIADGIRQAGAMNPVILLDEIDKLTRDAHGDPSAALLEVLDPDQNKEFRDHFIEIPIDLSNCMFIATANTLETVPRPLIDRMEIISLSSYTSTEKLSILKNHLLPKELKRHGLSKRNINLTDDAAKEIIEKYTKEAGVRGLSKEIASLCRKTALRIVETGKKSYKITPQNLKDFLGSPKIKEPEHEEKNLVGVVNGLAWTELGGDMLQVEALSMEGTGKLELTGKLGDVMQESAKAAVSYIRKNCASLGIAPDFHKKLDIHIHVPEGAVPKDGPSAGVTITTALVSELSGRKVRSDVAMTGEITLTGRVLPIGGLKEKTMAAYKAGIKTLIIPKDNETDLEECDPLVRNEINFVFATVISDVLNVALAE